MGIRFKFRAPVLGLQRAAMPVYRSPAFETKKDACVSLLFELRLLSESQLALKTHGEKIDWSRLSINHVGAGRAQHLIYNTTRRFVRVHVPNLMRTEAVFYEAIPWIRANLRGRVSQYIVKLPNELLYRKSRSES